MGQEHSDHHHQHHNHHYHSGHSHASSSSHSGSSSSSTFDSSSGVEPVRSPRLRRSYEFSHLQWRIVSNVVGIEAPNRKKYSVDLSRFVDEAGEISLLDAVTLVITDYPNVWNLNLRFNRLQAWPEVDYRLQRTLRSLSIAHNSIKSLDDLNLGAFVHLEELDLSSNPLTGLPPSIENCHHLTRLVASNMMIKALPDQFCNKLTALQRLDLFNSQLLEIPQQISHLSNLNWLDVGNNYVTSLPGTFTRLHRLEWLSLAFNKLPRDDSIPERFSAGLSRLCSLSLKGCHIKTLSSEIYECFSLTQLDLSDNKLSSMSMQVLNLTGLVGLNLNNNPDIENDTFGLLVEQIRMRMEENEGIVVWRSCLDSPPQASFCREATVKVPSLDLYHKVSLAVPWGASKLAPEIIIDKIRGLVFGAALGDAVGLATEFMTSEEAKFYYGGVCRTSEPLSFDRFVRDRHRRAFVTGDWTDDTDQLLVLMRAIKEEDGNITPENMARRLVQWAQRGFPELGDTVGQGIGSTTLGIVSHPDYLVSPIRVAMQSWEQSERRKSPNGSLMRTAIIGVPLFYDFSTVIRNAKLASLITHVDPRCTAACVSVSLLIANMLRGNCNDQEGLGAAMRSCLATARKDLVDDAKLDAEFSKYYNATCFEDLNLNSDIGYVLKTLGAAMAGLRMSVLPNHRSTSEGFKTIISKLVMMGGDADTNGAVCGALLGCFWGFRGLPQDWIESLVSRHWLIERVDEFIDCLRLDEWCDQLQTNAPMPALPQSPARSPQQEPFIL